MNAWDFKQQLNVSCLVAKLDETVQSVFFEGIVNVLFQTRHRFRDGNMIGQQTYTGRDKYMWGYLHIWTSGTWPVAFLTIR